MSWSEFSHFGRATLLPCRPRVRLLPLISLVCPELSLFFRGDFLHQSGDLLGNQTGADSDY